LGGKYIEGDLGKRRVYFSMNLKTVKTGSLNENSVTHSPPFYNIRLFGDIGRHVIKISAQLSTPSFVLDRLGKQSFAEKIVFVIGGAVNAVRAL
jgi:hypothetical protein